MRRCVAKLQTSVNWEKYNKSFKYRLNKIGPKTDPWGTPLINSSHELKDVLTLVLCHHLER